MKENIIHVLTIRFQVYIFLIVSISAGLVGLILREDVLINAKVIAFISIGIIFLLLLIITSYRNYVETNDLIYKKKK